MRYWLLGASVSLLVVFVAVWLPNWRLLWRFPELWVTTLDSFRANFSPLAIAVVSFIAIETGVYVALLARTTARSAVGIWGLIAGFFGLGCASCGSVILTGLLGLTVATAFLEYLPWRGQEFGFLAIGLLGLAIVLLFRKLRTDSCKI